MSATSPPSRSTASLILAIAERQDRRAFADLFAVFAPKVKAFLLRRRAALAEELTQEVMLTVWRKAAGFDPKRGTAEAWIFTIARNASIDAARRDRGLPLLLMDPFASDNAAPLSDSLLEAAEAAARVRAAVKALSPEQYEVVRLSFFDDCAHADISAALRLPLGTVKSRLRLALRRLRERLDDLA